jgi:prepilin-type N-terminal cleavage/methylation domain-containing protein
MAVTERGFTISEVLVVLALAALVLTISFTQAIGWIARAESRSAVYSVQSFLQRARMEAVSRNRACMFTLDTATRQIRVVDLVDGSINSNDILLSNTTLSEKISFARPDSGAAVTLASISGSTYGATFGSDGSLSAGAGIVSVLGGPGYLRVSLYGAGGAAVERWDGTAWVTP